MQTKRTVNVITATLVSASLLAFSGGVSHAATPSQAAGGDSRSEQAAPEATPESLPAQSLDTIRAEAKRKGLTQGETQLAVETQRIINEYHSLPDSERDAAKSEADLQDAVEKAAEVSERSRNGSSRSAVTPQNKATDAVDCVLAIADVASIAVPGGNAWKIIKLLGGVTEFSAFIVQEIKSGAASKTEDALFKKFSKEFGRKAGRKAAKAFSKALGAKAVVDSCSKLA